MPTLNFKGKSVVRTHHLTIPYRQLTPVLAKSLTAATSLNDNLIVHGDNLLALKALMPSFSGKIKCIYIDPPYNTGNENWVYNDNVNSPMHNDWLKKTVDREDLTRHDKWLCMMWPRLTLLRELLAEDGVIFISIDDNEVHHLRAVLDEIFGEENFIACIVWEKGRKNDAKFFSTGHEYILVYVRSIDNLRSKNTIWRETKPGAKEIQDEYLHLRDIYGTDNQKVEDGLKEFYAKLPKNHPAKKHSRYGNVDNRGVWRDDNMSWPGGGGPDYDVIHPITGQICAVPDGGWRYATKEKMMDKIAKGFVVFRSDHTEPPIRKTYLVRVSDDDENNETGQENGDDIGIQVMGSYLYKSAQPASRLLTQIFGKKIFDNPKDHEVLARIIRYVTRPGDIILDSFAGSGTTAQAILTLNGEDGGNRKFILIEQEGYADSVTAERVRRVIQGVPNAKDEKLKAGLGGSFTYLEMGATLDDEGVLSGNEMPSYLELAQYAYFTATGEKLDLTRVDESRWYLGESHQYQVYLLYKPDIDYLKENPLNLEFAREKLPLFERFKDKPRLVIASHKYVDDFRLQEMGIEFCQLPFSIYKYRAK